MGTWFPSISKRGNSPGPAPRPSLVNVLPSRIHQIPWRAGCGTPGRALPVTVAWSMQSPWQNDCMRHTPEHRQTVSTGTSPDSRPASSEAGTLPLRPTAHRLLAAIAAPVLAVALSGCTGVTQSGIGTQSGSQQGPAEPAPAAPSVEGSAAARSKAGNGTTGPAAAGPLADTSGGSAAPGDGSASQPAAQAAATETVKQTVTDALGRLAAGSPKPATVQVSDALTGAGIAPGVLEVSQSRTPTGLEADAVEAAVRQGSDCVIGQVREGAVAVTVLPVLASGKCFVGS